MKRTIMKRTIILLLVISILLFLNACSDDDGGIGKDPRLLGLWNGYANGGAGSTYAELELAENGYTMYFYDRDIFRTNMYMTNQSSRGDWSTSGSNLIINVTDMYDWDTENWSAITGAAQNHTYTLGGTNIGDLLTLNLEGGAGTMYFTNRIPYSVKPGLAGNWRTCMTNTSSNWPGTMIVYQTNSIQSDGSFINTVTMHLTNVTPAWSNFMYEQARGTLFFNDGTNMMINMETTSIKLTNIADWATRNPAYSTNSVFIRERLPVYLPDANSIIVWIDIGPVMYQR